MYIYDTLDDIRIRGSEQFFSKVYPENCWLHSTLSQNILPWSKKFGKHHILYLIVRESQCMLAD